MTKRQRAEEQLQMSQVELFAILNHAPIVMVLVDRERRVRKVNRAAIQFADRTVEEMTGLYGGDAFRCLYSFDDPKGCGFGPYCQTCVERLTVVDTLETGNSHHQVEVRLPFLRGGKQEELTFLMSTALLNFPKGEMVLVCFEDITERKRAETALKEAHDQLELRVQERTAQLSEANKQLGQELHERKQAEEEIHLLLETTQAIGESRDFNAALEHVIRKMCQATDWDFGEAWLPSLDGKVLELSPAWYSTSNSLRKFGQLSEKFTFPPNTGLPGRVWSSKRPEWIPDVSSLPVAVFPRAKVALEAGLKAGFGVPIIADGQVLAVLEFFRLKAQEEDKRLVKLVSGVATQLGAVFQRKLAEEKQKQLRAELALSSRLAAIGELAAGVAHEINNPLTGIIGFSELLMRKNTDEKVRRDLEIIHSEGLRAAKIVENLLTFARQRKLEKEYADVNDILKKALDLRAYELKTSNVEVVLDLASSLPKIMVNFHQVQEVFLNIILNAEQAMTEANRKGKLIIKTQATEGYIRASFADDGPGISAEHLAKLFDPFFTTRGAKGGTGLGLSICHGIITEHGGRLYAKSKPGEGATFFVELPRNTEKIGKSKATEEKSVD